MIRAGCSRCKLGLVGPVFAEPAFVGLAFVGPAFVGPAFVGPVLGETLLVVSVLVLPVLVLQVWTPPEAALEQLLQLAKFQALRIGLLAYI